MNSTDISVMEGNMANVCVQLNPVGITTTIGCNVTISLSINSGKASMFILNSNYFHLCFMSLYHCVYICISKHLLKDIFILVLTEPIEDYTDPGTAIVIFVSGETLPAVECVNIQTNPDNLLEGVHEFSAVVYNTSLDGDSLITISSDSTTIIRIIDDDGEIVLL